MQNFRYLTEFIGTFFLVLTVLDARGFSWDNPAVAIGACMMGLLSWSNIWGYYVAEAIGGGLAAVVFRGLRPDER